MYCGPGNLQMLHHHPFKSYSPAVDNVPDHGILPPGSQPLTPLAVSNYPCNQPQSQQQHPIPGHSACDRYRKHDREPNIEWEREREHSRRFGQI